MIKVICPESRGEAGELVTLAFIRSLSTTIVARVAIDHLVAFNEAGSSNKDRCCWVLIDPLDCWVEHICSAWDASPNKMIIFGVIPPRLATFMNASLGSITEKIIKAAECSDALRGQFSQSDATVCYTSPLGEFESPIKFRPFLRYDFINEWNNLGFGAISVNRGSPLIWSLAQILLVSDENSIAQVEINGERICSYAAQWNTFKLSLLWFNRSVGPIDSQEWALVEHFVSSYRSTELPCWPVLREIPYGYSAAVTMRLDCDEDIESARPLWEAYCDMQVSFSLALHTGILNKPSNHSLPKEVLSRGGALLSHTATHSPNWGGSYEAAFLEATRSAERILEVTGYQVRYAVSPFHQTPSYARSALRDAGYFGCIGGIVGNDPDFLTARSGKVYAGGEGFIGHSQQCMLHGDCVLVEGDAHSVAKQAFSIAKAGGAFFGYLDHPFSLRYQYGWKKEKQRIEFHQTFVKYIRQTPGVLFCNEADAMDFLRYRANSKIILNSNCFSIVAPVSSTPWGLSVVYRGEVLEVPRSGLQL